MAYLTPAVSMNCFVLFINGNDLVVVERFSARICTLHSSMTNYPI